MLLRAVLSIANEPLRKRLRDALRLRDVLVETVRRTGKEPQWEAILRRGAELFVIDGGPIPEPVDRSLAALHALPESPEVIVISAEEDPGSAARLLAARAAAVLWAGLPEELLVPALEGALERLRSRARAVRSAEPRPRLADFISESPAMHTFLATVRRVTASDSTLLITGETGVGKEHLARGIHAESPRGSGPFVAVNCGALPETLLESELFGHQEGAFTGAMRARRGWFELAHRGTIFLDEIGEMPPHLQVKLLGVIQHREVMRLGGESPIPVDVRVMAATNRDLAIEIESGHFRRDLYYRLGVVRLEIPPLRERREDIPDLVASSIRHFQGRFQSTIDGIEPEALSILVEYDWPGNVRELINVIERAMLLSDRDKILPCDLPIPSADAWSGRSPGEAAEEIPSEWLELPLPEARRRVIERFERTYLAALLERAHGRIGEAAALAGIGARSLYEQLRQHGLHKEDYRPARVGTPQPRSPARLMGSP